MIMLCYDNYMMKEFLYKMFNTIYNIGEDPNEEKN